MPGVYGEFKLFTYTLTHTTKPGTQQLRGTHVLQRLLLCVTAMLTHTASLQVNHISPQSEQFKDFVAKGDASEFAEMFVDWDKLWPSGARCSPLPTLLMYLGTNP